MYKIQGAKLKKVRKDAGLTQEELATVISKNKVDIGHYENNRATPPANALVTFLIELGINPKEIAEKV